MRKENLFPNDVALFYIAEITLAMQYLHERLIAYRDLKPENLLIGSDGHLKITDFGFAKKIVDRTFTLCGTPEYLAPEIIMGQGHDHGVDWWALGILTYEMIVGFPPFYTGQSSNSKMYELIKTKPVYFPDAAKHGIHMSEECKDFINGCLKKKPDERLGTKGGLDEILAHDAVLTPGRYVGVEEQEGEGEPFEEKMARLADTLRQQMEEARLLDAQIGSVLSELNYGE